MLKMGFFGKKKSRHAESTKDTSTSSSPDKARPAQSAGSSQQRRHSGQAKSVRFASAVSDDEGGFMTDSEVEINRATRHGSLRVRGERALLSSVRSGFANGSHISSSRPTTARTHGYSEWQPSVHQRPASHSSLWNTNGTSAFVSQGAAADDEYMSDASTASSFTRGSRTRSSLPILRNHNGSVAFGLVFLTHHNETVKVSLPAEIRDSETVKTMFLKAFPKLNMDFLNSSKRRFYILDRPSNKFFPLIHLNDVRDGTMLKLVDSESLTPATVRKSRSAHAALSSDSNYYSEPEFDVDTASLRGQRSYNRMAITKETNIDEPLSQSWSYHSSLPSHTPPASQPLLYLNTTEPVVGGSTRHIVCCPNNLREAYSDWNLYRASQFGLSQAMPGAGPASKAASNQPVPSNGEHFQPNLGVVMKSVHSHPKSMPKPETTIVESSVIPRQSDRSEVDSHSSKDSTVSSEIAELNEAAERSRMAKMEAQIANLTAWVQTALTNRPSSCASDRVSEFSYNSVKSSLSGASSSTPQPEVSADLKKRITSASTQLADLKTELKQLRRIHEAQAETIQETLKDSFTKIQNAVANIPGAKQSPLRNQRTSVDVSLDAYKAEQTDTLAQISDLEACVSELRTDVVSKRCHVNMTEVEALALKLSNATRRAADMKLKFPKLTKDLNQVLHNEMENVLVQQQFLSKEPERIEDALRHCKSITNVLFTLKRLAAIDTHRTAVVPMIHTKPVEDDVKKQLLKDIQATRINHTDRVKAIRDSEQSVARRKDVMHCNGKLQLVKSLELASDSIKEANSVPAVEIDGSKLDDMMLKAKSDSKTLNAKVNSRAQQSNVIRRSKPHNNKPLQFYQNRDSINWDAESDSDCSDNSSLEHNPKFIDVTEAPASAFSVVQPQNSIAAKTSLYMNSQYSHLHPTSIAVSQPSNGKIYQAPNKLSQAAGHSRSSHLQQQYQKLQEMQRHFRTSPSIQTATPTSPSIRPVTGALNGSFITPTSSRSSSSCSSGKPAIAPKPQLLADRLTTVTSKKDTDNNSLLGDTNSTTV